MKEVNVLVVGLGLAGLAYVETLRENQKSFHVIDQSGAGSSVIATKNTKRCPRAAFYKVLI